MSSPHPGPLWYVPLRLLPERTPSNVTVCSALTAPKEMVLPVRVPVSVPVLMQLLAMLMVRPYGLFGRAPSERV